MLTLMASIEGERLFMISLDQLMLAVAWIQQEWWEMKSEKSPAPCGYLTTSADHIT